MELLNDKTKMSLSSRIAMAVVGVVIFLFLAYNVWIFALGKTIYPDFYSIARFSHALPDTKQDFIPQGVTYFEKEDCDLVCGYMDTGDPSRIYKMHKDGTYDTIGLKRENGEDYTGHAGGITAYGNYVYISNQAKLFVLDAAKVAAAKDGDVLQFEGYVEVPCNASFCSSSSDFFFSEQGVLYVGEYHEKGYETDASHELKTPDGSTYYALVFGYELSADGMYGLKDDVPDVAFSVCDRVQGFCIGNYGVTFLSCSKGLQDSYLKIYKTGGAADGSFRYNDVSVPMYYLDSSRHVKDIKMPHMSEDLEFKQQDGTILMSFEAAAKKFGNGWLPLSINRIVVIDPANIQ